MISPGPHTPPRLALRFFRWYCRPKLADHIEGDLIEAYQEDLRILGKRKANLKFIIQVLTLFKPGIVKTAKANNNNEYAMYKSYFKIGWRNIVTDKGYSLINIGGLALGLAVALLIGLWVYDEVSYNKKFENYRRTALVLQHNTFNGNVETYGNQSYQLGAELRDNYGNLFEHVVMSYPKSSILSIPGKAITMTGNFIEAGGPELLTLRMMEGTRSGLEDISSMMLSSSCAKAIFGSENPIGKILKLDNRVDLKITGVYEDTPDNSGFRDDLDFIAPLQIEVDRNIRSIGWGNNWLQVYVQLADKVDIQQASIAIREAKMRNVSEYDRRFRPELFLHPMSKWRLYSHFKNGVNVGGRIEYVWMFGIIGVFVLTLACINFMNLSTARSQKRCKEVGVRKVIGSARGQLVRQFFSESLLVVLLAFASAILLVQLLLPAFNDISDKNIAIDWHNPTIWLYSFIFILVTALLAGSYPAFYLSAFNPINVLKGRLRVGRFASMPRKVLVILQFSVSIVLVLGTIVVYQQIEFARNRPIGYETNGLVTIPIKTEEVKNNYEAFKAGLLASRTVVAVSASETTVSNMWWSDWGFQWEGKDPNMQDNIYRGAIDYDFGKVVQWKIKNGRDFSEDFPSDSSAMILNEAAVTYMGFDDPVGQTVTGYGRTYTVIGVVEDMITQSLYQPVGQTIFILDRFDRANFINVRINPGSGTAEALENIEQVFSRHNPSTPFEYIFADDEFAEKFAFEARVGKLVGIFSLLAIFISCLGLFGLSSFVAEQRTKEIGIRKVMGASVPRLLELLTKEFVYLVVIACIIAIPTAYYFMSEWLTQYDYRTDIPWSIFAMTSGGALIVTLFTVSFQALNAAFMNPVKSLRSE